jgi:putative hydrolase of the HAD superfamily
VSLKAVTLDYWDTIYHAISTPDRVRKRHESLQAMLRRLGAEVSVEEFTRLYKASAVEADRWWRDEHRGYTTADRIRWLLAQLAIERPEHCEHIARAVEEIDETLTAVPPALLEGAADGIRTLAAKFKLGIISDTGFASGRAQDKLLAQDGLLQHFSATVYSMDVGHAKPRPEPFRRALELLEVEPSQAIHVGDIERTDVGGALAAGMRAVRLDQVRPGGSSDAEYVATSYEDLVRYLTTVASEIS